MRRESGGAPGAGKQSIIYGLSGKSWGRALPANAWKTQAGYRGWEDHFLFEVIDTDTGKAAVKRASRANW